MTRSIDCVITYLRIEKKTNKKNKKRYYASLNERCVTDNNFSWKAGKHFHSDKIMSKGKMYLTKNYELVTTDKKQRNT